MHRRPHHAVPGNGNSSRSSSGSSDVASGDHDATTKVRKVVKKRYKRTSSSPPSSSSPVPFKAHFGPDWFEVIHLGVLLGLMLACGIYTLSAVSAAVLGKRGFSGLFSFDAFRWYHIPNSMTKIGDKSRQYQLLRKDIDVELPPGNPERSLQAVEDLRINQYTTIGTTENMGYDIHNCPPEPPAGYPFAWNIMDVLKNWPPDDPAPREHIHHSLCIFDFNTEYEKAVTYRDAEVPFVVKGDPAVAESVERWNHEDYMKKLMNTVPHRTEYSENNHFMYWLKPPANPKVRERMRQRQRMRGKNWNTVIEPPSNWTEPTKMMRMVYAEWLDHANVTDDHLGPEKPHWYYRLIGCGDPPNCDQGSSEYLFDELTFFQPRPNQLYIKEPHMQKGIHCRFGMKGVIAENHFDGSRNAIVVLGGERRYILSHPDQCNLLALHPKEHPSARHSAVDWSNPNLEQYPQFQEAKSSETVLQAGDVLYLPTNWFHYIISLTLNFQCNTRSGVGTETMSWISDCGF